MGLKLHRNRGQIVVIGDHTIVRVVDVGRGQCRLEIVSSEETKRGEHVDADELDDIEARAHEARQEYRR